MKRVFILFACLQAFATSGTVFAQISEGGEPASFAYMNGLSLHSVKAPYLAPINFDVEALKTEDRLAEAYDMPPRFAVIIPVDLHMEKAGDWSVLPNGQRICRLTVQAPGAIAIILSYSRFFIPEGGKLFIYNAERTQLLGAYSSHTNPGGKEFASELVAGDEIILEYNEPLSQANSMANEKPDIRISGIGYGYNYISISTEIDPPYNGYQASNSCQVNINCSEGANWQNQKKGVTSMAIPMGGGSFWAFCSGAIINNTAQDLTPYYLTASHCIDDMSASEINQTVFYFHYESQGCASSPPAAYRTMVGAQLLVNMPINGSSDGALLRLNQNIPTDYDVYYNGWDRRNTPATGGAGIHHPKGDVKKIATFTSPLTSATWSNADGTGAANAHWRINDFAKTPNGYSQTESGSSGSPLFNQYGLVVGTCTGGTTADCASGKRAWYGKFWYHWDNANSIGAQRMKDYLDPLNSGVETLAGTYGAQSGNANLKTLAVSPGTLAPAFSALITSYTVNVDHHVSSITVSATAENAEATVTGAGVHPLHAGNNVLYVVVTVQGSVSKTYTVTVVRAPSQSTPDPYEPNDTPEQAYSLPVSFTNNTAVVKTTGSDFHTASDIDYYKIDLPSGYNYSLTARLHDSCHSDDGNTYTVDGKFNYSMDGSRWSNFFDDLMQGNIIMQDGGTVYFLVVPYFEGYLGSYLLEITVERAPKGNSADVGLKELFISPGELATAFSAHALHYTAHVAYSVHQLSVTATTSDPNAMVTGVGLHHLDLGNTEIAVEVTAQDGVTVRTYTITVVRALPGNNANLHRLTIDRGALTPSFDANVTNYTVHVENDVTEVNFSATAVDDFATVTGTGQRALTIGNNVNTIIVIAENGMTFKMYTVTVVRKDKAPPSDDASLGSIMVDNQPAAPKPADAATWQITVGYTIGIFITATPSHHAATIPENQMGLKTALPGVNLFEIAVTAENGNKVNYCLEVTVNDVPTKIEDTAIQPLTAYPNPARDRIVIGGLPGKGVLSVFDTAGRLWMQRNISSSEETIFVNEWKQGNYFVRIVDGNHMNTVKIIVEK